MTTFTIRFAVGATVTRADLPVLCTDLADELRGRERGVVVCDVTGLTGPDLVAIEALARLRLTARRHGWRLVVSGAGPGLRELAGLLGLSDVLFEPVGQAEQREQAGGVEEVVDRGDPAG
ncbi:STAS domain-containing protein [Micromonospora sp. C28SCA-DRY-2]|uniref:STAS domain-containing protein n=1 Tax=Micromonospora sp. C28SCA-DRY-2 TaxID=3059522 RepID=UPI002675A629|nr:STAS domain-containing protein [Micromonospora sp. C28SCA-DRY-2]MDO3700154.1 STAS domain-containing protein [Micromonospora sp. C28SCA-DRY-2]